MAFHLSKTLARDDLLEDLHHFLYGRKGKVNTRRVEHRLALAPSALPVSISFHCTWHNNHAGDRNFDAGPLLGRPLVDQQCHVMTDGITDDLMSRVQVQGRKKAISDFSGFIQDDNAEVSSSERL